MVLTEVASVSIADRGVVFTGRDDADRVVVRLRGEHDISTVAELSEALARAVAFDQADLVVDLSELTFMDASTIGVIIRARNFLRLSSRSLVVRSPSRSARRILDICGLADVLDAPLVDA